MLIDVYPYTVIETKPKFFLFRRGKGQIYATQWRMIGGKKHADECYWQAALRELREETGLNPLRFWTLPSVNTFYEHKTDQIHHVPAFAAQLPPDALLTLNHEHERFGRFECHEAIALLQWSEQKRLLQLADELIRQDAILPDWEITLPAFY